MTHQQGATPTHLYGYHRRKNHWNRLAT
jgi:hypothetical protein